MLGSVETIERPYQSVLLAESYREDGTVKRRTLANMTQWPPQMVAGIEVFCQGGVAVKNDEFATGTGKGFGLLYALKQLAINTALRKPWSKRDCSCCSNDDHCHYMQTV